jgi:DNA-binding LytR/AlgR family response regulator
MPVYSAIIADDEQPLRDFLKNQLRQVWPELDICAEARNGIEAKEKIEMLQPDIAFLDIKMPVMTGMEVARKVAHICRIVFITAYDQFAVEAFENEAVDYLLKPLDFERLQVTVRRLKERLGQQVVNPDSIHAAIKNFKDHLVASPPSAYLKWIKVVDKQNIRLISVEEICCFQAQDKYTVVHTRQNEFLIRKPIKHLLEELDPEIFWQIHRSTIVNAAWIDRVSTSLTGKYVLTLKHISGTFTVSRNYRHRFKSM